MGESIDPANKASLEETKTSFDKILFWTISLITLAIMAYRRKNFKNLREPILAFILSIIFLFHGIQALLRPEIFVTLLGPLGITGSFAKVLVTLVGLVDTLLFFGLNFKMKKWMLYYAGMWPLVPTTLTFIDSQHIEWIFILSTTLALLIYFTKYKKQKSKK